MAIASTDVKLMQPERITDESDGGGQMTGNEIVDGDVNNMFDDVSRLDRTYGRVSLRKAFLKVDTANADKYLGSHVILGSQPADPNVSALIFDTGNFYDERAAAQDDVESYVVRGPVLPLYIYGDQLKGQKSIITYQQQTSKQPEIGDVIMLRNEDDNVEQYVQITDITESEEVYTYYRSYDVTYVNFTVRQLILQLSAPLNYDFVCSAGIKPVQTSGTAIYSSQTADSAKYYGTTTLASAITKGNSAIYVSGTFAPLLPTATNETVYSDQNIGDTIGAIIAGGSSKVTLPTITLTSGSPIDLTLPTAIVYGSLEITINGVKHVDDAGVLVQDGTSAEGYLTDTSIDYQSGIISGTPAGNYSCIIKYQPGTKVVNVPMTGYIDITDSNRAFNYVFSLSPVPVAGTFKLEYQYLDKWYTIEDDGTGSLSGDGSGTVNYDTGSVVATLLVQPDASSTILFQWSNTSHESKGDESYSGKARRTLNMDINSRSVVAGTINLAWTSGGVAKSATDDGAGNLTGDATGSVDTLNGLIHYVTDALPDTDTDYTLGYDYTSEETYTEEVAVSANTSRSNFTIQLGNAADLNPGSIKVTLTRSYPRQTSVNTSGSTDYYYSSYDESVTLRDDADSNIIESRTGNIVGSIDYVSGLINITGTALLDSRSFIEYEYYKDAVMNESVKKKTVTRNEFINAQTVTALYQQSSATVISESITVATDEQYFHFYLIGRDKVLENSVLFTIGSDVFIDNGAGSILYQYSALTGAGVSIGSVNYDTSEVTISNYDGMPGNADVTVLNTVTGENWMPINSIRFRTAASPLRPSGLTLNATTFENETTLTATMDDQGVISGDSITGEANMQDGIVSIDFAVPVIPDQTLYNAVTYKTVPLDADVLGLDPVKLPANGKVPIIRDADVIVITNTQSDEYATYAADDVLDAARTDLAEAWLEDASETAVDTTQYVVDLEAGTITLNSDFVFQDANANALTGSLFFKHRVEDMALVTEARIDGKLTLANSVSHDYPTTDTWVATALIFGDLQGRVTGWKELKTAPSGFEYDDEAEEPDASYNLVDYPVAIDSQGAVPDVWKILFTSSTAFSLYSENRGLIASGDTGTDLSPINPQTGTPYFTILYGGWGGSWSVNNAIMFETKSAAAPFWVIRTVLPGSATVDDDKFSVLLRGDAD
ncbi:hypothetical protein [Gynuella sp.]|uniref:hypothetical protein n=1 Tax=Gynuella sp. TaxID=2969146 RepID=UPI003D0A43F7